MDLLAFTFVFVVYLLKSSSTDRCNLISYPRNITCGVFEIFKANHYRIGPINCDHVFALGNEGLGNAFSSFYNITYNGVYEDRNYAFVAILYTISMDAEYNAHDAYTYKPTEVLTLARYCKGSIIKRGWHTSDINYPCITLPFVGLENPPKPNLWYVVDTFMYMEDTVIKDPTATIQKLKGENQNMYEPHVNVRKNFDVAQYQNDQKLHGPIAAFSYRVKRKT